MHNYQNTNIHVPYDGGINFGAEICVHISSSRISFTDHQDSTYSTMSVNCPQAGVIRSRCSLSQVDFEYFLVVYCSRRSPEYDTSMLVGEYRVVGRKNVFQPNVISGMKRNTADGVASFVSPNNHHLDCGLKTAAAE